jgi:hypothetical protein
MTISQCADGFCATTQLQTESRFHFLVVQGAVADTLEFEFNKIHTRCCGTVSSLQEITLNGVYLSDMNTIIEIVEK